MTRVVRGGRVIVFKEEVAESFCEYNIGSMQKGCEKGYDLDDGQDPMILLNRIRSLNPGETLVIIKEGS